MSSNKDIQIECPRLPDQTKIDGTRCNIDGSILLYSALGIDTEPRAKNGDCDEFLDNSRLLEPGLSSKHPRVGEVVNLLWQALGYEEHPPKQGKRRKEALKNIVCSLIDAEHIDGCVAIPRSPNKYKEDPRYGLLHFKHGYIVPLIDRLLALGFLHERGGTRRVRTSRYWASQKLLNLWNSINSTSVKVKLSDVILTPPELKQLIQLKNHDKNLITYKPSPITTQFHNDLVLINESNRNLLGKYLNLNIPKNEDLEDVVISLIQSGIRIHNLEEIPISPSIAITHTTTDGFYKFKIPTYHLQLYRVFNHSSFNKGGRHYAAFQQVSEECRSYLRFDGQKVVELDFTCMHPTMLYHQIGATPPSDPYGHPKGTPERQCVKLLLMVLFNSGSKNKGIQSILRKELKKPKFRILKEYIEAQPGGPYKFLAGLYDRLTLLHAPLSSFYHKKIGVDLQYVDSEIARHVMLHFVHKGVPIFPVHDSFIITMGHSPELQQVMQQKYQEVMKKHYGLSGDLKIGIS